MDTRRSFGHFVYTSGTNARSKTGLHDTCVILDTQWVPYLPKLITVPENPRRHRGASLLLLQFVPRGEAQRKTNGPGRPNDALPATHDTEDRASIGLERFEHWTRFGSEEHGKTMSSVLRYDKSSKFAADDQAIPARARLGIEHTARRLAVCLFGGHCEDALTTECLRQFMVEIAASRHFACKAARRFGLHSCFVSDSCLPPTVNRSPSAGWIRKIIRDIWDSV